MIYTEGIAQQYWSLVPENSIVNLSISDKKGLLYFDLDGTLFKNTYTSSKGKEVLRAEEGIEMVLPNEKGEQEVFDLKKTSVLSPLLQAKYPQIRTFIGKSRERPDLKIRLSYTPTGINAWIRFPNGNNVFLQPLRSQKNRYVSYSRMADTDSIGFNCSTPVEENWKNKILSKINRKSSSNSNTGDIKTFRLAISTSGGYTTFWGDDDSTNGSNQEDAFAAVVSTINRVNEIFEMELGMHLELVSGIDLIYSNSDSDPYTTDLIDETQEILDEKLGNENYD